jgi:hypothetical protein
MRSLHRCVPKLAGEVESSAILADLLQKLNGMQEAQARPADFKKRLDAFVARAEEYLEVVRPFIRRWCNSCPLTWRVSGTGKFRGQRAPG